MKALHAAIDASGGRVKDLKSLGKDHRGAAAGAKKPGGLARQASMERHRMMQLAKLEREVSQRAHSLTARFYFVASFFVH